MGIQVGLPALTEAAHSYSTGVLHLKQPEPGQIVEVRELQDQLPAA